MCRLQNERICCSNILHLQSEINKNKRNLTKTLHTTTAITYLTISTDLIVLQPSFKTNIENV